MRFCLVRAPLASLGATLLAACTSLIDDMRNDVEGTPTVMAEAQANQKLALVDGCLASVIGGQPLRAIMAAHVYAKETPPKDTGSPTAVAAWRLDSANTSYVLELPGAACSMSVMRGDPQQLYDAAVALLQTRGAFVQGMIDTAERGDAERTTWCTAGPYPHVAVLYKRTTGRRVAFLANVYKAQGASFSACRPNG
jgi:hypothetical protein